MNRFMPYRYIRLLAWTAIFVASSDAWAQTAEPERERGWNREGRRGGRGWFGGFSDEDQAEMNDRRVDRYMQRFTRRYDLNETQQQQVKAHLEQLKAQQEAYAAPLQDEMRDLADEARELRRARAEGAEVDNERSREIWRRFSEIRRDSPLLDASNVTSQIETLLPPEQVKKAQEENDRRGFQRGPQQDRWRRYVDRFCDRFKLEASQRATAEAVFRNLNEQRERYRQAHKDEYTAAEQIQVREERFTKQRALNQPIDQMFTELQSKLDQIPTAAQKAAAPPEPERRRGRTQTQPATTG